MMAIMVVAYMMVRGVTGGGGAVAGVEVLVLVVMVVVVKVKISYSLTCQSGRPDTPRDHGRPPRAAPWNPT